MARSRWVPAWSPSLGSPATARRASWSASRRIWWGASTRSIWCAAAPRRWAARVAGVGPTWLRPAAPTAPRHKPRSTRSRRRSRAAEHPSSLLAVEICHRGGGIAGAGGCALRHGAFDRGDVLRAQRHTHGAERLGEPIAAAGADDGYDIGALRRHPGNRRLRNAETFGVSDLAQRFDQSQVRIDVVGLEARAERAKIAT